VTTEVLGALFGDPFAVMNTIGLVAFALVGSTKAVREEFDLFGVAVVGLAMAFAGGATRDLLVSRVPLALQSPVEVTLGLGGVALAVALRVVLRSPFILFEDFYASCAVLGGTAYWLAVTLGFAGSTAAAACAAVTAGTRLAAVTYGWTLPTIQRLGLTGR